MTFSETLAVSATRSVHEAHGPYSVTWWENSTAEELRDIIKRGFAGGLRSRARGRDRAPGAREQRRLREVAAVQAAARRKRKKIVILGSLAATAAIGTYATLWITG